MTLAVIRIFPLPPAIETPVAHLITLGLVGVLGWLFLSLTAAMVETVSDNYAIDQADNLSARRIQTQIKVLHRIVIVIVSILTVALALMTFPRYDSLDKRLPRPELRGWCSVWPHSPRFPISSPDSRSR